MGKELKKSNQEYERPGLVDLKKETANGDGCDNGTGADSGCFDGPGAAGEAGDCAAGEGVIELPG